MMELPGSLEWRAPLWWWLALTPWVYWLLHWGVRKRRRSPCAEPELLPWAQAWSPPGVKTGSLWRHVLAALAWLLFALALSGPRLAEQDHADTGRSHGELMLVFDLSRSMTARDVAPSRMEFARQVLESMLNRMDGLRIGLVVYSARPHLLTPPTADRNLLQHDLGLLRHGLLPSEGSALQEGLVFAVQQFTDRKLPRALLVVTDGGLPGDDEAASSRLRAAARQLAAGGTRIHVLGVGTPGGGALQAPDGSWLTRDGEPVIAILHEQRLQTLAHESGGAYARIVDGDGAWRVLYQEILEQLTVAVRQGEGSDLIEWRELYSWFLLPALVLMFLSRAALPGGTALRQLAPGLLLLGILGSSIPRPALADGDAWQRVAYAAYLRQSYQEARQAYARVPGYAGRMGEASSAYQLGKYRDAVALFTQAVLDADTDQERANAVFNLANTHYRLENYEAAVATYQEALLYDPSSAGAQTNLRLARNRQRQQAESEDRLGGRQGRGPRRVRMAQGIRITSGRLGIDETPEKPLASRARAPLPMPSAEEDLLNNSILYAQPVISLASDFKDSSWVYAPTTEESIALDAEALEVDESRFWQHLFEQEEGYAAPVDVPHELPGVLPW
ncbi:VWA domain-containing protein [Thiolapillus brandeum]|uniref:VWFA domain-containing protein n=1 Tax=Thiolapillus brandeum TaxID=1076588 RepID=A0A7U6GJS6_9GAMM|nr:VWA domain-containing protein [Thiolapillus brandeum]BAO44936.1 hypothetical protein TBH_C2022 [Thiolapillus brandeum]